MAEELVTLAAPRLVPTAVTTALPKQVTPVLPYLMPEKIVIPVRLTFVMVFPAGLTHTVPAALAPVTPDTKSVAPTAYLIHHAAADALLTKPAKTVPVSPIHPLVRMSVPLIPNRRLLPAPTAQPAAMIVVTEEPGTNATMLLLTLVHPFPVALMPTVQTVLATVTKDIPVMQTLDVPRHLLTLVKATPALQDVILT